MKLRILTASLLLAGMPLCAAELELSLPRGEWVLQSGSTPLLQREAIGLPTEQELLQDAAFSISRGQFEEALAYLRERQGEIVALVEAGDPDRELRSRVVAGGIMPNVQRNQVSAAVMYLLGHLYLQTEQYAYAETALRAALGPLPDYVRVHETLGMLYMQTGDYAAARDHLSRAATLGLNSANLYGALGYLNQQSENYWGAIAGYQQAMMLEPENRQWRQGLLYSLTQSYQYQSGLTLVDQMLLAEPDDVNLWLYRSQLSLLAGERQQALTSLEAALRLGEKSLGNLQVAGTLHLELGSVDRAVELLQESIAQGLDWRFVDQTLAWLLRKGDWARATELLDAVREGTLDEQERSSYLMRRAAISFHNGDLTTARRALEDAIRLNPDNAEALMLLAELHRDARSYSLAELYYQRASTNELFRENAYISMAQLAIDQDDPERALQLLQDVVQRNPMRSDLARNIESIRNLVLLRQ